MNIHLRRGHVAYFSCHSLSHSLSHSAYAMFILLLWTEVEGKHCKSTMTKTKTMTGKISNKISWPDYRVSHFEMYLLN